MRAGKRSKRSNKMEDVLSDVITLSRQYNFKEIKRAAEDANDFLGIQQGLVRDAPFELREKCFGVFRKCFETKKTKFMILATTGIAKLLRDGRFHSTIETEDDSKWLPSQLLQATATFPTLPDEIKAEILKIFLNVACSHSGPMNGRIVISIVSLCMDGYESRNAAVRAAAQTSASQTLRSFCNVLLEEMVSTDKDAEVYNELLPIMQFVCSKIDEVQSTGESEQVLLFLLECMLTIFTSLPNEAEGNQHLISFLWQKLSPVLISVLGSPRVDKNIVTRTGVVEEEKGRGSGCLAAAPRFTSGHARIIYATNIELVRIFGEITCLRPVLESMFHRVLLYPSPEYRYDAIKSVAELMANPTRVLDIAGPISEPENIMSYKCDMSLIRLIMDSLEESSTSNSRSVDASVLCCLSLLKTLQEFCYGCYMPFHKTELLLRLYPDLENCNYQGPKTYQSMSRLPINYREEIQHQKFRPPEDESQSSEESEKQCSDSSSDSDGLGEYGEDTYDSKDLDEETAIRNKITNSWAGEPRKIPVTLGHSERQHALHFVGAIHELLPTLVSLRSCIQVDQAIQNFASRYCQGVVSQQPATEWGTIINADGIYFATYAALTLNLTLCRSNYYDDTTKEVPITEDEFVNEVQNSGVVVYLSGMWLRELYQNIVSSSLLHIHGYLPTNDNSQQHALLNVLTDLEGMETSMPGSKMLSECWRLEKVSLKTVSSREAEAGKRLTRMVFTCCWDSILKVLTAPLMSDRYKLRPLNLKTLTFVVNENREKGIKQTLSESLEGLQIALSLCKKLGLQDRCGNILELLASASCPLKGEKKSSILLKCLYITSFERLTSTQALNLELLLSSGLEVGSYCPSCWPHLFRCCVYVKKLERSYFTKPENRALATSLNIIKKKEKPKKPYWEDDEYEFSSRFEEDSSVEVYSFLCSDGVPQTVSEVLSRQTDRFSTDLLEPQETAKIILILSQLVDKLFEDAAMKLNLKSLECFSRCLCDASQKQLLHSATEQDSSKTHWWLKKSTSEKSESDTYLLLDSLGEVFLKCVKSGRPLIHIIKMWAIIGPYLMESASQKDLTVARKAVKHMHDGINAYLNENSESPFFHVNESLIKPFENLLCLDLCDPDIQDLIASCLCEFVEANYTEIRSGWKPLFGALRIGTTSNDTILEIFRIFLETDNALVFSNAAIDCILCLLNQIRSRGDEFEQNMRQFLLSLDYLKRCELILGTIFKMSHCLVFNFAHRIQIAEPMLIDPNIPGLELVILDNVPDDLMTESTVSYAALSVNDVGQPLEKIDRPSGVLRVWFLLIEGVHSAAVAANPELQPKIFEMLFNDLTEFMILPGADFALYCMNRYIIPMTQSWLRQLSKDFYADYTGFKQGVGMLSDLVGSYFEIVPKTGRLKPVVNLMLTQVMLLLAECCIHHVDTVARLGSSCFRHILNGAGIYFNSDQWNIASLALHRACDVTLTPLRQLTMTFSKGSENFYGDTNQIKIAARSGFILRDIIHMKQLSQQVFLMDCQRDEIVSGKEKEYMNERYYTFLITASNDVVVRMPLKTLVVALLTHQSLLQVVAGLLLHKAKHMVPSLASTLFLSSHFSFDSMEPNPAANANLPGFMGCMSTENINVLLSCLDIGYRMALVFDSRPGLKFLVQRVASLERVANLYRQAVLAWNIKTVVLFEISITHVETNNHSADDVKEILESPDTENEGDFEKFLKNLRQHFNELCTTYVDLISYKKEMDDASLENTPDKPLLFALSCEDDDMPEMMKSVKAEFLHDKFTPERRTRVSLYLTHIKKGLRKPPPVPFYLESDEDEDEQEFEEEAKGEGEDGKEKERESEEGAAKREEEEEDEGVGEDISHDAEQVNEVLNEYRKRKNKHLKSSDQARASPASAPKSPEPSTSDDLEMQRRKSFLKDKEAHRKSLTDMFGVVFELLSQLKDEQFKIMLLVFLDGIRKITPHPSDTSLKEGVDELFQRVSVVFGSGSP